MKYAYLVIVNFVLIFSVFAAESSKLGVNTNNSFRQKLANKQSLEDMKTTSTALSSYMDAQEKCTGSGLIYLGDGATDTDVNFCFDVEAAVNPPGTITTIRPSIAGTLDLVSLDPVEPDYDATFLGRLSADKKCNTLFPDSRAMTFADLKYLYADISQVTYNDTSFWVFDTADTNIKSKEGANYSNLTNCNAWTSAEGADFGLVISVDATSNITLSAVDCVQSRKTICVSN
ncbi:MAG: hypothetical protein GY793_06905 [Proteobacteria bacterium]|nr:hypothetical protein [Pseudomonadota bacterium]